MTGLSGSELISSVGCRESSARRRREPGQDAALCVQHSVPLEVRTLFSEESVFETRGSGRAVPKCSESRKYRPLRSDAPPTDLPSCLLRALSVLPWFWDPQAPALEDAAGSGVVLCLRRRREARGGGEVCRSCHGKGGSMLASGFRGRI